MSNTRITLHNSGVTGNTPSLGVLANGEVSLNFADGILYYKTDANTLGTIRTTDPAGLNQEIQFNDSGSFGGNSSLTFNKTTGTLFTDNVTSESAATNTYIQFGDGTKQYTANSGSSTVTFNVAPPESGNTVGDVWIDSNTGVEFVWVEDEDTSQWVEFGGVGLQVEPTLENITVTGTLDVTGDTDLQGNVVISLSTTLSDEVLIDQTTKQFSQYDDDAKAGRYILKGTTTDDVETEIFIGGIANTRVPITANTTILADISIAARRIDGTFESAGWKLSTVADNNNGTTSDAGNVYEIIVHTDDVNYLVDARADDTNDSLNIYVTGVTGKNVSWTAVVTTTEVIQ